MCKEYASVLIFVSRRRVTKLNVRIHPDLSMQWSIQG